MADFIPHARLFLADKTNSHILKFTMKYFSFQPRNIQENAAIYYPARAINSKALSDELLVRRVSLWLF
jgi:hypothetical protein